MLAHIAVTTERYRKSPVWVQCPPELSATAADAELVGSSVLTRGAAGSGLAVVD